MANLRLDATISSLEGPLDKPGQGREVWRFPMFAGVNGR